MPRKEEQQVEVAGMPKDADRVSRDRVFAVHGGLLFGTQREL